MLTPQENELLTKVTDGAPMERIMRSHWVPICLSEELPENDGTPLLVEVLGVVTSPLGIPMGRWVCWTNSARTGTRHCCMVATKTAV